MTRGVHDVAIVGAGPAGSILAARLASAGLDVIVLERSPAWRWRAGGVFASPAAVQALAAGGLDATTLERVTRPIPAMVLTTRAGVEVRLTYGAESGGPSAVGFDRSALDPALMERAIRAGADVRPATRVTGVRLSTAGGEPPARSELVVADGVIRARMVVGADGTGSVVARAAGVARPVRLPPRVGLSYHLADAGGDAARDARLQVIDDGYVGIAPVPGGRVNVGIVLGPSWGRALRRDGAATVAATALTGLPVPGGRPCDAIAGASPLGGRVTRRAGPGWFLVGDAAGFLDPFSGEGLHRAAVSADLAARAILAVGAGRADPSTAAAAYDRAMRRRFATKDGLSWLLQAFLARPAAFEYGARRLAARPDARATMGLVMGDLIPARHGLDPRFLAAVLAP